MIRRLSGLLIVFLIIAIPSVGFCQNTGEVYPLKSIDNGLYGIVNENLEWVVPPEYDYIKKYTSENRNFFKTKVGEYYGLIDEKGNRIIEEKYRDLVVNKVDSLICLISDKYGSVDMYDNLLIPGMYDDYVLSDDFIIFVYGEEEPRYYIYTNEGEFIDSTERYATSDEGYLFILKSVTYDEMGPPLFNYNLLSYDMDGKLINSIKVLDCEMNSSESLIPLRIRTSWEDDKLTSGYFDNNLNNVLPCNFNRATGFENGRSIIELDGKKGVVDDLGKLLINPEFESISFVGDGLYVIKKNSKSGLLREDGKYIISPKFDSINVADNSNLCLVISDELYHVIDKENRTILLNQSNIQVIDNIIFANQTIESPTTAYDCDGNIIHTFEDRYDDVKKNQYKNYYDFIKYSTDSIETLDIQENLLPKGKNDKY